MSISPSLNGNNQLLSVEDFGRFIELKDKQLIEEKSRSYSYIDSEGNILIADYENHRFVIFGDV